MAAIDPSIALGFQMPKLTSPMEAAQQMMTLKALQQQSQVRNLEIQQGMQTLKDQQELSALAADRSNIDPETGGLTPEALTKLTNPMLRQKLNQDRMATKLKSKEIEWKTSEAGKLNDERQSKALHDVFEGAYAKYEDVLTKTGNKQAATEAFNKAQSEGYEDLKTSGRGGFTKETQFRLLAPEDVAAKLMSHKERADEKAKSQTPFLKETEYLKELEGRLADLKPTDPAAGVLRNQIRDVKAHIAKLDAPPKYMINGGGAAAGAATLQGDALDMAANQMLVDGRMPAGFARNSANVGAIYKRAAELAKQRGMTGEEALFNSKSIKADQTSLSNLTKQYDMINSFESTALKNLDMLVAQSKKVPRGSFPLINKALMTGKLETGDPETAKYYAIVKPFVDEYAKILSGQTGSAGASDAARREAAGILSPYFSEGQINQLAPFIKQELKNRTGSLEEQRDVIKARMRSGSKAPEKSDDSKNSAPVAAPKNAPTSYPTATNPQTGEKLMFKDGKWQPMQ